jgi:hypothetical protein
VRLAKALTSSDTSLSFDVAGTIVTIKSQNRDEELNKAKWIVFTTGGFATEESAQQLLQLASLADRLGIDLGSDKPTSWVSEAYARSTGLIKADERIAPNVHGLVVNPDDDKTRFPVINPQGTVTANPQQFTTAITEASTNNDINFGDAADAVRVLNLALMTSERLAQMVLAFSAVEEFGQREKWSEVQSKLIKRLTESVSEAPEGTPEERAEVALAMRNGLFRVSLRQGVMRLLDGSGMTSAKPEWDRLYGIRSGLFHGTSRLTEPELHQAAMDTIKISGRIILGIVARNGVKIPSIAATQYQP